MTTVVIVPGSFSIPSLYDSFVEDLEKNGVRAVVVKLASVGRKETPGTLSDDVDAISEVVTPLLDAGQEVVLLTHSYGGVPGSQSLEKLSDKARRANGGKGIKKIIYMASVILPVGTSNMDATRASIPDWMTFEEHYMVLDTAEVAKITFSDMTAEEGLALAKNMDVQSIASFEEKLSYPGYNDVDEVHYILCEEDKVIPPQFQEAMLELLKTSRGKDSIVHRLKSGHAPSTSQSGNVVDIVKKVIEGK
ncbi:unnamed protein product [Clonostachys chloroleuca]|uniref:AB hydrolase-1 domain-containing protein n=1 Tax=Clonostachys chloroleuca TaxID=1926264 RepID=A0AA35PWQ1_9HYPO|nr:unnamed protein product [Clonostachys chloroleuca]